MAVSEKICPLCTFEATNIPDILGRLRTVHSSDPRFLVCCGIDGCSTTLKDFSALYSHIYHYHDYVISVSSHQSLILDLFDYNVYHGHKLTNGFTYIYLKHYVM